MSERKKITVHIDEDLYSSVKNFKRGKSFTNNINLILRSFFIKKYGDIDDDACPRLRFLEDLKYYCIGVEGKKRLLGESEDNYKKICSVCDFMEGWKKYLKELEKQKDGLIDVNYVVCSHYKTEYHPTDVNKVKCPLINYGNKYHDKSICMNFRDGQPCKYAKLNKIKVKGIRLDDYK